MVKKEENEEKRRRMEERNKNRENTARTLTAYGEAIWSRYYVAHLTKEEN